MRSVRKNRKPGQVSLERALSKLGIVSRTQARTLILEGRVKINGVLRKDPLFYLSPEKAKIEIDGAQTQASSWKAVLLHKPRGTITSRSDEKGRPTVFDCLKPSIPGLHAVGRLDWASSGLLILTNDTQLSAWLTDPENGVPRVYAVSVRGKVNGQSIEKLTQGVRDAGEILKASEVTLLKASEKESHLLVQLKEGKNREIRRLCASLGHEVTKLKRVAFGGLELKELEPGKYIELSREEMLAAFPGVTLKIKKI